MGKVDKVKIKLVKKKTPVKKNKIISNRVKTKAGLTAKQELFCKLYASDREYFANGVHSYLKAYGIDVDKRGAYGVAQAASSRMLSNVMILKRINELLCVGGLNEEFVDKQLSFMITQHSDFTNKMAGIREFNKLRGRITEKIDHTTKGKELPVPILGGASNVSTNNSD